MHVEDVAPEQGQEPVRYLTSEPDGIRIRLDSDGRIRTIFLMSEGKDGFHRFQGELPGGLAFDSSRGDALKALGSPALYRAAGRVGTFDLGELLRFDRPSYSVHLQFRATGGIDLVTIMVASAVPGRSREAT